MTELLVRKISRAKWRDDFSEDPMEIPADPVTSDLRTTGNRLSMWAVPNREEEHLKNVLLAMCTTFQALDKVDFVIIEKSDLESAGVQVEPSLGNTPITELQKTHRDAVSLNLIKIGKCAAIVKKAIDSNESIRLSRGEVKKIIADAIKSKLLSVADLDEKIRKVFD